MVLTRFKSAILKLFVPFHGTFSRHGKAQASLALLIWLNENVVFAAKLLLLIGNKDYIYIKLPKRVVFSQIQGI